MKINREEHPILIKSDFDSLLEQLTELEMLSLKEATDEYMTFNDVPDENEIKCLISELSNIINDLEGDDDFQQTLRELDTLKETLQTWIKKKKS